MHLLSHARMVLDAASLHTLLVHTVLAVFQSFHISSLKYFTSVYQRTMRFFSMAQTKHMNSCFKNKGFLYYLSDKEQSPSHVNNDLHDLVSIQYTIRLSLIQKQKCYFLFLESVPLHFIPRISSAVQSCQLFATPWTAAHQASLCIMNSRSILILSSIESVMPSNHVILCHPLLPPPSLFPSIRVFSSESVLRIRWPKQWNFCFSISPSNECSGLISFRMDWLDLLAVQGTLKSLLQHHSSKASLLQHSPFFIVQLSHPYMTTGKTTTEQTDLFGNAVSLLF